jgi:hypothetical protein
MKKLEHCNQGKRWTKEEDDEVLLRVVVTIIVGVTLLLLFKQPIIEMIYWLIGLRMY